MATFQRHATLFHITLVQQLHAQTIQNGYYMTNRDDLSDASFVSSMTTALDQFKTFVFPHLKGFQSQELVYRSLIMTTLVPRFGPIVEQVLETSQGDQVEPCLPSYCAAVLSLRTGDGGKSNRGRSYYSGIPQDFASASRATPDLVTRLQNLGNQLLSLYSDSPGFNPFTYCLYSRRIGDSEGGSPTALGIVVIRQTIARSVLGTQRHRKIGIGN